MNFHGEQFNSHLTSKFAPFKCSDQASLSIWNETEAANLVLSCVHSESLPSDRRSSGGELEDLALLSVSFQTKRF